MNYKKDIIEIMETKGWPYGLKNYFDNNIIGKFNDEQLVLMFSTLDDIQVKNHMLNTFKENKNFLEAIFYLNINKKNDKNKWFFTNILDNNVISDVVRNEAFLTNDKELIFDISKYCNNDLINKILDKKILNNNLNKLDSAIYSHLISNKNITTQNIDNLYFDNKELINDFLLESIYKNKKVSDVVLVDILNTYTKNNSLELYNNPNFQIVLEIKTILCKDNIEELNNVLNYAKENSEKFNKPMKRYFIDGKLISESNEHEIDELISNLENKIRILENNIDFER